MISKALEFIFKIKKKCRKVNENWFSVLFRFFLLRFKGVSILAHSKCEIYGVVNIVTNGNVLIGLDEIGFLSSKDLTLIRARGSLIFKTNYSISKGCRIDIGPQAKVHIGSGYMNAFTKIIITKGLTIGDNTVISWDCLIMDSDFHEINSVDNPVGLVANEEIIIGSNVWIGCGVTILKGVKIPDGTIIAAGSLVNKSFSERNTLIGGMPAKVLKNGVSWK